MAEKEVRLYYRGPDGAHNYDVAEATGGPAKMSSGSHYEVPEELAKRLLLTTDWQEMHGSKKLTGQAQEQARKEEGVDE